MLLTPDRSTQSVLHLECFGIRFITLQVKHLNQPLANI